MSWYRVQQISNSFHRERWNMCQLWEGKQLGKHPGNVFVYTGLQSRKGVCFTFKTGPEYWLYTTMLAESGVWWAVGKLLLHVPMLGFFWTVLNLIIASRRWKRVTSLSSCSSMWVRRRLLFIYPPNGRDDPALRIITDSRDRCYSRGDMSGTRKGDILGTRFLWELYI